LPTHKNLPEVKGPRGKGALPEEPAVSEPPFRFLKGTVLRASMPYCTTVKIDKF